MAAEMKALKFYGASDDLIEVEGDLVGCDEYNAESAAFEVAGVRVRVIFGGCWMIGVEPIDEEVMVAAENMRLSLHEKRYSMQLDLDVPAHSYVTKVACDA